MSLLPYFYNFVPSKNSHLNGCVHDLPYAYLGKTTSREFHIWHRHLFPLSEVLCVWSAAKVEDESNNCGESDQKVPEAGGHCQVFRSPSEKPHHLRLFSHCSSLSAIIVNWQEWRKGNTTEENVCCVKVIVRFGLCALMAMVAYCQNWDFPTWGWRDDTVVTCHCHWRALSG